jgi:hypothetical protein
MYRTLVCLLCLTGLTLAPLGCAEKSKSQHETKVTTPGGSDTKTVTVEDKKTGDLKDNNTHTTGTTESTTTTTPAPNP